MRSLIRLVSVVAALTISAGSHAGHGLYDSELSIPTRRTSNTPSRCSTTE